MHKLSHEDLLRLLGHKSGLVTAILEVRRQIGAIRYRYSHVSPHHTKKLAKRDAMLQPLVDLERILLEKAEQNRIAYEQQKSATLVA